MFSLKTIFIAALLALEASTAPTSAPADVVQLQKRQSTTAAFTVARGQFRKPYLGAASFSIQTSWKPSGRNTNIVFTNTTVTGSGSGTATNNRYFQISFRGLNEKIAFNSQYNGKFLDEKLTPFTIADATFEANPDTKERLVRISLVQGFDHNWTVLFFTKMDTGYGGEILSQQFQYRPHDDVIEAGIEPTYIWYENNCYSHLSSELHCGTDWW
ncbi:hypothetical protein TWF281_007040 [Arthrobotrys megalospora]